MRPLTIIILLNISFFVPVQAQEIYKATGVNTSFFSSAPIENIEAHSTSGISLWNTRSGEISFRISIRSFQFEKGKMQEHFNEDFMESHQYPYASFKGHLQAEPNLSEVGEYPVVLEGTLEIHGVKQERKIKATLKVMEGTLHLQSSFPVTVADHQIKIPRLLFRNIAEVVKVDVEATYKPLEL